MFLHLRELLQVGENPKVLELFASPHVFQGLPELRESDAVLQAYVIPSFEPLASWTIYHQTNTPECRVRRVVWKRKTSVVLSPASSSTFGADAVLRWSEIEGMLRELSEISFPAFLADSCLGIDGTTFGIRRISFMSQSEAAWWNKAPPGWEKLGEWYESLIRFLELKLPERTY